MSDTRKYVILRQEIPESLTREQVRGIIAAHFRLDPDEVLMNCVGDMVCAIRRKVKDEDGKPIGVRG